MRGKQLWPIPGEFPADDAPRSAAVWSVILGVKPERIPDLFRERGVTRKFIARVVWAKPSDVWNSFPSVGGDDNNGVVTPAQSGAEP
jgi:hypothetical protein